MINDGHLHLHYEGEYASVVSAQVMLEDMKRVDEKQRKYEIDKIAAIVLPVHVPMIPQLIEGRPFLRIGLYFGHHTQLQDYQMPNAKFDFVKFHDDSIHWNMKMLEEALNLGWQKGFRRFQFHSNAISTEELSVIEKFCGDTDAKVYLAHGVYALYPMYAEKFYHPANPSDVRKLSGNLFLGTTNYSTYQEVPHEKLKKAIKDGIADQVCFESDFAFWWIHDENYGLMIRDVKRASGNHRGVMHDNLERFLE